MTRVTLRPRVTFSTAAGQSAPAPAELTSLHHEAHAACFLANSVLTEITCEPQ
jgi:organic hydroperoxide reductase OsmC/OhrA